MAPVDIADQAVTWPKFGVAISNFNHGVLKPNRVGLYVGDTVVILEEIEEWYYGYKSKESSMRGIFPKCYIAIKDCTVVRTGSKETVVPVEPPIAQEVTSVLAEWGTIAKQLYINRDPKFETVRLMMFELIAMRSQALSGNLPVDELKELKHKITAKIDHGNALLDLDLVVRDNQGNILNPELSSAIDVYRAHETAMKRIKILIEGSQADGDSVTSTKTSHYNHNLFVTVMNFVCRIGEDADLLMSLYDGKDMKFISENYLVRWGKEGLMRDLDQLNNLKVLFSDLGSKDLSRDKILIVCQIIRIGGMELKDNEQIQRVKSNLQPPKRNADGLRRPFGVAAMDITDVITGKVVSDEDTQHFVPFMPCGEKDSLDTIIKKIIATKGTEATNQKHKGQGLWVSLKMIDGDDRQVREDYAHLVSPFTTIARKMGFPEVILPGDVRNDLYLTLAFADFSSRSSNAKNIEVAVKVCNEAGSILPNVIKLGAGTDYSLTASEYKSVVYYHEEKPKWMETFKITIPIDEFYESHLRFTFKHRSSNESKDKNEKPFAFAFMKLMNGNGTTLRDQTHDLLLYKIDGKKFDESAGLSNQYLNLPSTKSEFEVATKASLIQLNNSSLKSLATQFSVPGLSLIPKDNFTISTIICSTKLTQNIDLLGLLKWSPDTADDALIACLYALMKVDGEEIVKFLGDTLDTLFKILMAKDSEDFDDLIFEALVFIIGLISDLKYQHFRPVLDTYIREDFSATLAYNKLILVLKKYIDSLSSSSSVASQPTPSDGSPMTATDNSNLLTTSSLFRPRSTISVGSTESIPLRVMKSLEYIFKFIVRSRLLFATLNGGKGRKLFEASMKDLLNSLTKLMTESDESHLTIQAACLKYFPNAIPDILSVFDGQELSLVLTDLINSIPIDKLKLQKILCVNDIVHTDCLFKNSDCRKILLPVMNDHIRFLVDNKEQLHLCVKVLSDTLAILHGKDVGPTKDDITDLMLSILRTVIQAVIHLPRDDPLIGNVVAVMIGILRQMTPYHYAKYINHFSTQCDLMDFLQEILIVFKDLVDESVYPKECVEMIMLQSQVILNALKHFAKSIRERFFEPFQEQLWNNFFHCAIAFMTQPPLQLENFSANKRQKIISKYKDMRRETAIEVRSMWYNLGQHKIQFVPGLVGPILEMTLIPEVELRKATIPIFFDMMQCEYYSGDRVPVPAPRSGDHLHHAAITIKGDFSGFEHEMITQLDRLVEGGRGDDNYKNLLYEDLGSLCESHSRLRDQGLQFVKIVVRLMKRLLEYRQVSKSTDENREIRMFCIVNLLEFYNEINRKEMYIRYLYKLSDLHLHCENYIEAAHTLLLHAKLLEWTDEPLPPPLKNDKYPDCETHRELKERLFTDIIVYFDKGKLWEEGLKICKELMVQYEVELYDYNQMANLLQRMSVFYENIMKQVRLQPEYFRVSYYGEGFPTFMQNKTFVYRGKPYEKLDEFQSRLINQFPNAQLLSTLSVPGTEVTQSIGQYFLINKVDPVMLLKQEFKEKSVSEQILKYYQVNEVRKFVFSRPKRKMPAESTGRESDNEFTNLWVERTTLITSYPLPGILRWFPVMEMTVAEISPIRNAIETVENVNIELKSVILQHSRDSNISLHPLSMRLNGIVDAAVNGGIGNYEKAFFGEHYAMEHCTRRDREDINKLKDIIASQIPLLQFGVNLHKNRVTSDMRPFHDHLESQFLKLKSSVELKYGKKSLPDELTEERLKGRRNTTYALSNGTSPSSNSTEKNASKSLVNFSTPKGNNSSSTTRSMSVWVRSSSGSNSTLLQSANTFSNTLSKALRKQSNKDAVNNEKNSSCSRKSKDAGSDSNSQSQWYAVETSAEPQLVDKTQKYASNATLSSSAPPYELSQSLTSHRPQRPDADKRQSRPISGGCNLKPGSPIRSAGNSCMSLCSIENGAEGEGEADESPPPLPVKTQVNNLDYLSQSVDALDSQLSGNHEWTSLPRPRKISLSKMSRKPLPPLPSDGNSPEVTRRHSSIDPDLRVPPEVPKRPNRAPPQVPADYVNVTVSAAHASNIDGNADKSVLTSNPLIVNNNGYEHQSPPDTIHE